MITEKRIKELLEKHYEYIPNFIISFFIVRFGSTQEDMAHGMAHCYGKFYYLKCCNELYFDNTKL